MRSEALRTLLALRDTGSVTAAAERRHLSQPALTRQLQQLAREVGAPLVRRQGRGVALTTAGEALAALAARQHADWEATLAAIRGHRNVPLRLGCGTTIALTLLPASLARLRIEAPEVTIHVRAGDSAATATRLLSGEIDAGLVTTAPADRRLSAVPLLRDPLVAVGSPGAPAELPLEELARAPLCLYARGTGFRVLVDELFTRAGLFPEPVAEMDSLEAVREMVAVGLGLSLLPRSVAAAAVRQGRLRVIRVPDLPQTERTIALLRHSGRTPHPAFAALHAAFLTAAAPLAAGGETNPGPSASRDAGGGAGSGTDRD